MIEYPYFLDYDGQVVNSKLIWELETPLGGKIIFVAHEISVFVNINCFNPYS